MACRRKVLGREGWTNGREVGVMGRDERVWKESLALVQAVYVRPSCPREHCDGLEPGRPDLDWNPGVGSFLPCHQGGAVT